MEEAWVGRSLETLKGLGLDTLTNSIRIVTWRQSYESIDHAGRGNRGRPCADVPVPAIGDDEVAVLRGSLPRSAEPTLHLYIGIKPPRPS